MPAGLVLEIVEPEPLEGMGVAMIHTRNGKPRGLNFWHSESRFDASVAAFEREGLASVSGTPDWGLSIAPTEEVQDADLAIFERLGLGPLDVGGEERFPVLMGRDGDGAWLRAAADRMQRVSRLMKVLGLLVSTARGSGAGWTMCTEFTGTNGARTTRYRFRLLGEDKPPPPASASPTAGFGSIRDQLRERRVRRAIAELLGAAGVTPRALPRTPPSKRTCIRWAWTPPVQWHSGVAPAPPSRSLRFRVRATRSLRAGGRTR